MSEPVIYNIISSRDSDEIKKKKILDALEAGADINAGGGYYQDKPLIISVESYNWDMVEFLIQNGADPWYINPTTGKNYVNVWAVSDEGFTEGIVLFAKYAAWKKPEWCEIYLKLIFTKGWPRANSYISGSLENMRKYK